MYPYDEQDGTQDQRPDPSYDSFLAAQEQEKYNAQVNDQSSYQSEQAVNYGYGQQEDTRPDPSYESFLASRQQVQPQQEIPRQYPTPQVYRGPDLRPIADSIAEKWQNEKRGLSSEQRRVPTFSDYLQRQQEAEMLRQQAMPQKSPQMGPEEAKKYLAENVAPKALNPLQANAVANVPGVNQQKLAQMAGRDSSILEGYMKPNDPSVLGADTGIAASLGRAALGVQTSNRAAGQGGEMDEVARHTGLGEDFTHFAGKMGQYLKSSWTGEDRKQNALSEHLANPDNVNKLTDEEAAEYNRADGGLRRAANGINPTDRGTLQGVSSTNLDEEVPDTYKKLIAQSVPKNWSQDKIDLYTKATYLKANRDNYDAEDTDAMKNGRSAARSLADQWKYASIGAGPAGWALAIAGGIMPETSARAAELAGDKTQFNAKTGKYETYRKGIEGSELYTKALGGAVMQYGIERFLLHGAKKLGGEGTYLGSTMVGKALRSPAMGMDKIKGILARGGSSILDKVPVSKPLVNLISDIARSTKGFGENLSLGGMFEEYVEEFAQATEEAIFNLNNEYDTGGINRLGEAWPKFIEQTPNILASLALMKGAHFGGGALNMPIKSAGLSAELERARVETMGRDGLEGGMPTPEEINGMSIGQKEKALEEIQSLLKARMDATVESLGNKEEAADEVVIGNEEVTLTGETPVVNPTAPPPTDLRETPVVNPTAQPSTGATNQETASGTQGEEINYDQGGSEYSQSILNAGKPREHKAGLEGLDQSNQNRIDRFNNGINQVNNRSRSHVDAQQRIGLVGQKGKVKDNPLATTRRDTVTVDANGANWMSEAGAASQKRKLEKAKRHAQGLVAEQALKAKRSKKKEIPVQVEENTISAKPVEMQSTGKEKSNKEIIDGINKRFGHSFEESEAPTDHRRHITKALDRVARVMGVNIIYVKGGKSSNGKSFPALHKFSKQGKSHVVINTDTISSLSIYRTMTHEYMHELQGRNPELYKATLDSILSDPKAKESYELWKKDTGKHYLADSSTTENELMGEWLADTGSEFAFDEKVLESILSKTKDKKSLYDHIVSFLRKVGKVFGIHGKLSDEDYLRDFVKAYPLATKTNASIVEGYSGEDFVALANLGQKLSAYIKQGRTTKDVAGLKGELSKIDERKEFSKAEQKEFDEKGKGLSKLKEKIENAAKTRAILAISKFEQNQKEEDSPEDELDTPESVAEEARVQSTAPPSVKEEPAKEDKPKEAPKENASDKKVYDAMEPKKYYTKLELLKLLGEGGRSAIQATINRLMSGDSPLIGKTIPEGKQPAHLYYRIDGGIPDFTPESSKPVAKTPAKTPAKKAPAKAPAKAKPVAKKPAAKPPAKKETVAATPPPAEPTGEEKGKRKRKKAAATPPPAKPEKGADKKDPLKVIGDAFDDDMGGDQGVPNANIDDDGVDLNSAFDEFSQSIENSKENKDSVRVNLDEEHPMVAKYRKDLPGVYKKMRDKDEEYNKNKKKEDPYKRSSLEDFMDFILGKYPKALRPAIRLETKKFWRSGQVDYLDAPKKKAPDTELADIKPLSRGDLWRRIYNPSVIVTLGRHQSEAKRIEDLQAGHAIMQDRLNKFKKENRVKGVSHELVMTSDRIEVKRRYMQALADKDMAEAKKLHKALMIYRKHDKGSASIFAAEKMEVTEDIIIAIEAKLKLLKAEPLSEVMSDDLINNAKYRSNEISTNWYTAFYDEIEDQQNTIEWEIHRLAQEYKSASRSSKASYRKNLEESISVLAILDYAKAMKYKQQLVDLYKNRTLAGGLELKKGAVKKGSDKYEELKALNSSMKDKRRRVSAEQIRKNKAYSKEFTYATSHAKQILADGNSYTVKELAEKMGADEYVVHKALMDMAYHAQVTFETESEVTFDGYKLQDSSITPSGIPLRDTMKDLDVMAQRLFDGLIDYSELQSEDNQEIIKAYKVAALSINEMEEMVKHARLSHTVRYKKAEVDPDEYLGGKVSFSIENADTNNEVDQEMADAYALFDGKWDVAKSKSVGQKRFCEVMVKSIGNLPVELQLKYLRSFALWQVSHLPPYDFSGPEEGPKKKDDETQEDDAKESAAERREAKREAERKLSRQVSTVRSFLLKNKDNGVTYDEIKEANKFITRGLFQSIRTILERSGLIKKVATKTNGITRIKYYPDKVGIEQTRFKEKIGKKIDEAKKALNELEIEKKNLEAQKDVFEEDYAENVMGPLKDAEKNPSELTAKEKTALINRKIELERLLNEINQKIDDIIKKLANDVAKDAESQVIGLQDAVKTTTEEMNLIYKAYGKPQKQVELDEDRAIREYNEILEAESDAKEQLRNAFANPVEMDIVKKGVSDFDDVDKEIVGLIQDRHDLKEEMKLPNFSASEREDQRAKLGRIEQNLEDLRKVKKRGRVSNIKLLQKNLERILERKAEYKNANSEVGSELREKFNELNREKKRAEEERQREHERKSEMLRQDEDAANRLMAIKVGAYLGENNLPHNKASFVAAAFAIAKEIALEQELEQASGDPNLNRLYDLANQQKAIQRIMTNNGGREMLAVDNDTDEDDEYSQSIESVADEDVEYDPSRYELEDKSLLRMIDYYAERLEEYSKTSISEIGESPEKPKSDVDNLTKSERKAYEKRLKKYNDNLEYREYTLDRIEKSRKDAILKWENRLEDRMIQLERETRDFKSIRIQRLDKEFLISGKIYKGREIAAIAKESMEWLERKELITDTDRKYYNHIINMSFERAEKLKGQRLKEMGYEIPVFHGSPKDKYFWEFDIKHHGENTHIQGVPANYTSSNIVPANSYVQFNYSVAEDSGVEGLPRPLLDPLKSSNELRENRKASNIVFEKIKRLLDKETIDDLSPKDYSELKTFIDRGQIETRWLEGLDLAEFKQNIEYADRLEDEASELHSLSRRENDIKNRYSVEDNKERRREIEIFAIKNALNLGFVHNLVIKSNEDYIHTIDMEGKNWLDDNSSDRIDDLLLEAKAAGKKVLRLTNFIDGASTIADDYLFWESSQVKSSETITIAEIDGKDRIIPLSMRGNDEEGDTRFSIESVNPEEKMRIDRTLKQDANLTEHDRDFFNLILGGFLSKSRSILEKRNMNPNMLMHKATHGSADPEPFDRFDPETRGKLTGAKSAKEGFFASDNKITPYSYKLAKNRLKINHYVVWPENELYNIESDLGINKIPLPANELDIIERVLYRSIKQSKDDMTWGINYYNEMLLDAAMSDIEIAITDSNYNFKPLEKALKKFLSGYDVVFGGDVKEILKQDEFTKDVHKVIAWMKEVQKLPGNQEIQEAVVAFFHSYERQRVANEKFNGSLDALSKEINRRMRKLQRKKLEEANKVGGRLYPLYVNIENPYVVDMQDEWKPGISFATYITKAKTYGHDGLIMQNAIDVYGNSPDEISMGNVVVFFNPSQAKLRNLLVIDPDTDLYVPPSRRNNTEDDRLSFSIETATDEAKEMISALGPLKSLMRGEVDFAGEHKKDDIHPFFDRVLKTIDHYSHKNYGLDKLYQIGRDLIQNKTLTHNSIIRQVIIDIDSFKYHHPKLWQKVEDFLWQADINKQGYAAIRTGSYGSYKWKIRDMNGNMLDTEFDSEKSAWKEAYNLTSKWLEKNKGFNKLQTLHWLEVRQMLHRDYVAMKTNALKYINTLEELGEPIPQVKVDGNDVSLVDAIEMMGDQRAYYMPRMRRPGKYKVSVYEGNKSEVKLFPYKYQAVWYASRKVKGLKPLKPIDGNNWDMVGPNNELVRFSKSNGANDAFNDVSISTMNNMLEDIISQIASNKNFGVEGLREYGYKTEKVIYKNVKDGKPTGATEDHIVLSSTRGIPKATQKMFVELGGYWDKANKRWAFKLDDGEQKTYDKFAETLNEYMLKTAMQNVAITATVRSLTEKVAEHFEARGSRSSTIGRNSKVGEEVTTGYEKDAVKVLALSTRATAGGMAKHDASLKMNMAIMGVEEKFADYMERMSKKNPPLNKKGEIDKAEMWRRYSQENEKRSIKTGTTAFKEAKSYMEWMLRNETDMDRAFGWLRGLAAAKTLSAPSTGIINMTSLITNIPAAMKARGYKNIVKNITMGMKKYNDSKRFVDNGARRSEDVEDIDIEIYRQLKLMGLTSEGLTDESMQTINTWGKQITQEFMNKLMIIQSSTEKLSRGAAIYASIHAQIQSGKKATVLEYINEARDVVDQALGVYGKAAMPSWARGGGFAGNIARSIYMFQRFPHHQLQLVASFMPETNGSFNPKDWTMKDKEAMAIVNIAPMILGGLEAGPLSVPFYYAVKGAIAAMAVPLGFDPPDEWLSWFFEKINEMFGWQSERAMRYGTFGLVGANVKGSMQINAPEAAKLLAGGALGKSWATNPLDAFGVAGSSIGDVFEAGKKLSQGRYLPAAEAVLPRGLSSISKAYRENQYGVETLTGNPVSWGGQRLKGDLHDTIMRALGFNPASISEKREIQTNETNIAIMYNAKAKELKDSVQFLAMKVPTTSQAFRDGYQKVYQEAMEFNDKLTRMALKDPDIYSKDNIPRISSDMLQGAIKKALYAPKKELKREGRLKVGLSR